LFGKVKEIPLETYTENSISLIAEYLVNVQVTMARIKNNLSEKSMFDCEILWNVIMAPGEKNISKKVKDRAIEGLTKAIRNKQELINQYVGMASSGITSNKDSRLILMKTLKKICQSAGDKLSSQKNSVTNDMIKQIVESLLGYKDAIKDFGAMEDIMVYVYIE